ncbi:LmbE family N-acetylglucosaminyl deacetylase [Kribbella antiqua]|uniref:LmbE family N-acetylglucosaminyl deacetylase n=1 Tax=Kribbella antiqua TaxID=2512217 RepID=A0A4R2IGN8_9ACTN|nr:PIG-L deacetylase family protein [Kribbella antiqua]TCO43923.1 LmbE family N-acetylglucosaminyl deacetylase [Kribbella antiqua]
MSVPEVGNPLPDDEIERVLVVVAHPDDIDFGGAGTVATWTKAGIEVHYCVVTDGQAGGFEPDRDRSEIPAVRRAEQTTAADHVGVHDLHFLGYVDGQVEPTPGLIRDITRLIRQVRPQRLLTQSPERWWSRLQVSHPDHLATAEATVRAFYPAAGNPYAYDDLTEDAWHVAELWMMEHPERNHWVDITGTIDQKIAALMSHTSQHRDPETLAADMRRWSQANATEAGLPDDHYAEAFTVIRPL